MAISQNDQDVPNRMKLNNKITPFMQSYMTCPCAIMASATFMNPAAFAPSW